MRSAPIRAACSGKFRAVHTSGERPTSTIRLIVLHSEEAGTAESAARWFTNLDSAGSAHLCVDDHGCYRTLPPEAIAWGAPGANTSGYHIEQAGFARWRSALWLRHRKTLERAAFKTALRCHDYGIPPVYRGARALKADKPGITTHRACTRAFGGTHTDPGPFWPRRWFMRHVRRYHSELATAPRSR